MHQVVGLAAPFVPVAAAVPVVLPATGVLFDPLARLRVPPALFRPLLGAPFGLPERALEPLAVRGESQRHGDRTTGLRDPFPCGVQDGLCLLGGGLTGVPERREDLYPRLDQRVVPRCGGAARGLRLVVQLDRALRLALPPVQHVGEVAEQLPTVAGPLHRLGPLRHLVTESGTERVARLADPTHRIDLAETATDLVHGGEGSDQFPQVVGDRLRLARDEVPGITGLPQLSHYCTDPSDSTAHARRRIRLSSRGRRVSGAWVPRHSCAVPDAAPPRTPPILLPAAPPAPPASPPAIRPIAPP